MSKYLDGTIVSGGDLERAAKQRANPFEEKSVTKPMPLLYKKGGWKIKKKYKYTLKIYREKQLDEQFEDEVWLHFKQMGFTEMNKDRNLVIGIGGSKKQIDVYAKDEDHIFLIECKSAQKEVNKDISKDIHEILNKKKGLIDALKNHYGKHHYYSFFVITKNLLVPESNTKLALENASKDFFLWKHNQLVSYTELSKQLGEHTKYILFSNIFKNKEFLENTSVPAICGGKGNNKYYYFVIQPEKLLSGRAYIHRREESNSEEIALAYQRMLNKGKLNKISEYVQAGNYFANNIIMNFDVKPLFEKKSTIDDIKYGILTFPKQYGCAWIIDGQHRLYGYLGSGKEGDAYIPVLAFCNMSVKDQANLFVDINKEQKPVSPALLWDLYSDLYKKSKDPVQQELRAISLIVKRLNTDDDSPLKGIIKLPSQPKDIQNKAYLTLTRMCLAIKENRLITKKDHLLFDENYDHTMDTATSVIKAYLNIFVDKFPDVWKMADKGFFCTNVGIRILLNILRQLVKYMLFKDSRELILAKDKKKFVERAEEILKPLFVKLKKMPDEKLKIMASETPREKIVENTQRLLWYMYQDTDFANELWKKGGWTPGVPDTESDKTIKKLVEETEVKLKKLIVDELKALYKDDWWKMGIPSAMKAEIRDNIEKDLSKIPWKDFSHIPNEDKLRLSGTAQIRDAIITRSNWNEFKKYFIRDKDVVVAAFTFFENLRHKYAHADRYKDLDEVEKGLGYWNMLWIRKCLDKSTSGLHK